MARVGLKINGTTKYLDDGAEEVLGTVSGINLCHTGPFIYATGNGSSAGAGTVAISKLVPPANVGGAQAAYAHASGLVDSWNTNAPSALTAYPAATAATTGAGTFRNWDLAAFTNSRPFMVGLLGDNSTLGYLGLKINGTTKNNLVPSAEDNAGSILRYANRQNCTLGNGFTGSARASKWGNCVVINLAGLTTTDATAQNLGSVPADCKPPVKVNFQLINHNTQEYWTAYIHTDGTLVIYNPNKNKLVSNAWGGAIYSTTNADGGTNIFTNTPLKVNGTQKNLRQLSNANYTCRATSVTGSGGTLYLWRWGNFVAGNCYTYQPGQTDALNGKAMFTIPTGFRPAATAYSTGYGFMNQSTSPAPASGNRIATQITTAGVVNAWSKAGFASAALPMGLSFYYYCNE
jgi:hypothetical protein